MSERSASVPATPNDLRRRPLGILLGFAAALCIVGSLALWGVRTPLSTAGPAQDRPNILLVVLDTVRADRLSSYGYDRPTTPEIDALGKDFIRFDSFYATSPWTIPSHSSLFTGLYPVEHGATQEQLRLEDDFATLAEILSNAGYETWAASGNPFMGPASNLAQGFASFVETWRNDPIPRPAGVPHPALSHFERFLSSRDPAHPFFAFINYMDAHEPFAPPRHFVDRFRRTATTHDAALGLAARGWKQHYAVRPFSDSELATLSDLYDAGLAHLSAEIGRLIDLVRSRGLYDDTLIVITSDHGEHFGEQGAVGHFFSLKNALVQVPLLIRVPGDRSAGRVDSRKGQLVDLFPTILGVAGIDPAPFAHSGVDLLDEDRGAGRKSVFSEYYYPAQVLQLFSAEVQEREATRLAPHLRRQRAVQRYGYRYLWSSDGRNELYHLASDPEEAHNLLDARDPKGELNPVTSEFARLLREELATYVPAGEELADPPGEEAQVEFDPETVEALRAVGYVQ